VSGLSTEVKSLWVVVCARAGQDEGRRESRNTKKRTEKGKWGGGTRAVDVKIRSETSEKGGLCGQGEDKGWEEG